MTGNEYGPFNSEREALSTRAAARIRAAFDAAPGVGASVPEALAVMTDACGECGVELGRMDLSTLQDIVWRETFETVSVAGMIRRAYEAGKAAGPDGREPPAAVEWGIVRPEGGSGRGDVWGCGRGAEAYVRHLLREHRGIHGDEAGWLVTREIGQWRKVEDDA